MKKQLLFFMCCLICVTAFSQKEKFDIASFTRPQGWARTDTNGTVAFLDAKTTNGLTSFCQIVLYPSTTSTGIASKNFKTAWQNLVAIPTKSKAKPVTQTEKTPDGWSLVTGAANITVQGITYKSILVNITGFGKTMNVHVNTAGGDYTAAIEKFFNDLDLDNSQNSSSMQTGTGIGPGNYDFITPEGWKLERKTDHLLIQNPESGCLIRIIQQPSSGNLEKDAENVFNVMYAGWQPQKTGRDQYILSKGYLPSGLEYCMMEAGMKKLSADGSRYDGFEDGAAMVVKAGTQIAIISVRHNSSLMAHGDCHRKYNTWRRFFNSFNVKNAPVQKNEEDPAQRIIGSWSMAESGATGQYVFAANGNYAFYGAIGTSSTSRDYNYEYLHIKTYAFQGDGSYSINNNQLRLQKRGTTEQAQFRFEKANYGGTGWKDRLWILTKGKFGENEVCYEEMSK
jgi:hypothetical protein